MYVNKIQTGKINFQALKQSEEKLSEKPTLQDVRAAQERIQPFIHRTPVLSNRSLNDALEAQIYFKCENFQKVGAFKIRGATNAVLLLTQEQASRGVVTHSSGNHAAALALASKRRAIHAYIVMPANAPAVKVAAVKNYGGIITFCEPTLKARESTARQIMQETNAVFIHPYNDDRIIAGQGTAAMELLEQAPELDYVLAPVGGGGLVSGTAITVKSLKPNIKVIACEPVNSDDAYRSLQAGYIIPPEHPDTIADGLKTSLGDKTFAIIQDYVDEIITVTEAEIIAAMRFVFERMKIIIEPSSAVPLAVLQAGKLSAAGKNIGVIISGGNVDFSLFFDQLARRSDK